MFPPVNEQIDVIRRGCAEIIPEEDLSRKLELSFKKNQPLTVKLGCDPSRPDLHLGHSVVLRKLRQFQDLGHTAVLIVGDFTGMIGDPSGQNKTRPSLSLEEARLNGESYLAQARLVLSDERLRMVYNSEWLARMSFEDVIRLASKYTIARILERDDFTKRLRASEPISIHELLYPLAQAMDSVAIRADIELGGTDQKFNLLVGREIQREYGIDPQVIVTTPILRGTDGIEKMSKSLDNYIALNDPPGEMYGKTLSIPDSLIYDYFLLTTQATAGELAAIKEQLDSHSVNPRNLKRQLAREIVALYHGHDAVRAAEEAFDRVFVQKGVPDDIPTFVLKAERSAATISQFLALTGLTSSGNEARRLILQGGVTIDGEKVSDPLAPLPPDREFIIKVGKRRFIKVVRPE